MTLDSYVMTTIFKNFNLKDHNSLKLGTRVQNFYLLEDIEELENLDYDNNLPNFMLGDGTNIIFSQEEFNINCLYVKKNNSVKQIEVLNNDSDSILIAVKANMTWDSLVQWTVNQGFYDLACLSLIPGRVGAAPVQNIGAYGSEIADTLISLTTYDLVTHQFKKYNKDNCKLEYRGSIFKPHLTPSYNLDGPKIDFTRKSQIITNIQLRLQQKKFTEIHYQSLKEQLAGIVPSSSELREAVIKIRNSKLPDYHITPNVGSFFKNPILDLSESEKLIKKYRLKHFLIGDDKVKLMAGELIELAGLKGLRHKNWGVSEKQSLVIIGNGQGKLSELQEMINLIQNTIFDKFELRLAIEPEII